MATTKIDITLEASSSNAAGATKTGTGVDVSDEYGAIVSVKVTNGATGPTIACLAKIQVSNDNSAWFEFWEARSALGNNEVSEWAVAIPAAVQFIRSIFDENTAQAVTVEAIGSSISAV